MNDFDYDALQKKRIARGAAHMKRGSKSKKCSLPSDDMTLAEWKRRNGPVSTYKLDEPIGWGEFRNMPRDIQEQYIAALQNRFGVSVRRISVDLFGLSSSRLLQHLREVEVNYRNFQGQTLGASDAERWMDWIHGGEPKTVKLDPLEEPTPTEETRTTEVTGKDIMLSFLANKYKLDGPVAGPLELGHLSATFAGTFDPETFMHWITKLPMPEGEVRINVEVCKK